MPRLSKRRDDNEPAIVQALEAMGCSVSRIENFGVPDLLVGYRGRTILLEVKNAKSNKGGRQLVSKGGSGKTGLTDKQVEWFREWVGGSAIVVWTPEEAVAAVRGAEIPSPWGVATSPPNVILSIGDIVNGVSNFGMSPGEADALAGALHSCALVASDKSVV